MGVDEAVVAGLVVKFADMLPHRDERQQRLYLGSEARADAEGCSLAAPTAVPVVGAAVAACPPLQGMGAEVPGPAAGAPLC
jgi:hypothetical protein